MPDGRRPQLYLVTPPRLDPVAFAPRLAALLDEVEIACLRLALPGAPEAELRAAAGALREVARPRDLPIVIDSHWRLVGPLGLDGVELADGVRSLREARAALGPERIVGAFCGASKHAGMTAAEMGADYVAFGPFALEGATGPGRIADPDLVRWWGEAVEVPVVAQGGLRPELLPALGTPDFLAPGPEIWEHPDGIAAALRALLG
jgi:thiamine-phosphate pyrophosphorylase